jgi:hypothetical protein
VRRTLLARTTNVVRKEITSAINIVVMALHQSCLHPYFLGCAIFDAPPSLLSAAFTFSLAIPARKACRAIASVTRSSRRLLFSDIGSERTLLRPPVPGAARYGVAVRNTRGNRTDTDAALTFSLAIPAREARGAIETGAACREI